ncbi:HAMP domain-containing histidine kinase [Clostridium sp. SHJSY1]|uniref:sensor histidine kinase n=1 Tax=Clostridium sp. SHJSY1 TaxID=2942483 RepID=UPI0028765A17|nr:HAMP domain-containing sensor histidine kinase [Clostridium sp. SHJSY1]MDS0524862.1 HAMP domain-containing histidine kinase [Clostridium sp. SHJSY1]
MNKKSIEFKLKMITLLIVSITTSIIIYSAFLIYHKNINYPTVNKGRVLTNSVKTDIEEVLEKDDFSNEVESSYKYAVIDLEGKVLKSSINKYAKGDSIDLKESLEYDTHASMQETEVVKYSAPLIVKGKQTGTIIFLIPMEKFLENIPEMQSFINLIPIIIGGLLVIILSIYLFLYLKKDILIPINSLHESACRILNGDFSYVIKYDYYGEIGGFCHDFEAMRDELKFTKEKEVEIKNNEKELLAYLSHDIKTPLTAISGYVSGIKDGIVKDRDGINNYCNITLNRVRMLTKLLDDILEHSKAELNKMNIQLEEFYSGDFFYNIIEDLSIEIKSKDIEFIYPNNIPNVIINGDRKRLSQVMYNLVSNGIKYSKEKGTIAIYFHILENYLYVYVKDNGMGISLKDVEYIFDKFYRGEKSRNQNIPGSGLGLSISKYIVEAHGGAINCQESSAKGTTMFFTIPI